MELVLARCRRLARATRALAGGVGAQRRARGWRAAIGQRAHRGDAAVRTQRAGARREGGPLGPRLGHFPHAAAAAAAEPGLLRALGRLPRPLRVVDVPIVLHHWHHERHLAVGNGGSLTFSFL